MNAKFPPGPALPKRLSLVAQTAQCLREGVGNGHWKDRLPGERELCELLQVSRRTVRAALADLQRQGWIEVSQRHRRCIRKKRAAPRADDARRVVGVLSPGSFHTLLPPTMLIMDALREKLRQAGCDVELHVNRACFSARPAAALNKLVHRHPAAAWLIVGSKEPMQRWFIQRKLPCLVLGTCAPGIALPSFDVDYHASCHHAGGVLWRQGHRRIGLVLPRDVFGGDVTSEAGLREFLHDMTGAHLRVLRHDDTALHLCALLDEAMRAPGAPTAWVVAHAMQVLTVMTHLMRRGKRIPQDAALIARDDDPSLQFTSPAVAHYAINRAQLARRVSLAVRQLAEGGALPARAVRLVPQFVRGGTI